MSRKMVLGINEEETKYIKSPLQKPEDISTIWQQVILNLKEPTASQTWDQFKQ